MIKASDCEKTCHSSYAQMILGKPSALPFVHSLTLQKSSFRP